MADDAIDFLGLILVLGLVVAIAFNLVIPMFDESNELKYEGNYDKTVQQLNTEKLDTFDSTYTAGEIVTTLITQNYFMPSPRVIEIAGNETKVENLEGYSPYSRDLAVGMVNKLRSWFTQFKAGGSSTGYTNILNPPASIDDARFVIRFNMNDPDITCLHKVTKCPYNGTESDDTYSIYIVVRGKNQKKGEPAQECLLLPNGKIQLKKGTY